MKQDIRSLSPEALWAYFYDLTRIPRPSGHEDAVRQYVLDFGKRLGLDSSMDAVGNVLIRKAATAGMDNRKGVILQSHLDMVPQKNSDKPHDFLHDPIDACVDGEWVTADGTSLGADNGIGAAAALAILAATDIEHGPLEALFTATEETGLDGARGLAPDLLKGHILLNLDSEDEGELYIGCAGGEDIAVQLPYRLHELPDGCAAFRLAVSGLRGGHSGIDINLGRANAIRLFWRVYEKIMLQDCVRLAQMSGGDKRNAIPREASGIFVMPENVRPAVEHIISKELAVIKEEFADTDPDITITLEQTAMPIAVVKNGQVMKIAAAAQVFPHGVMQMSRTVPGLVETSSNLAVCKLTPEPGTFRGRAEMCFLIRSMDDAKRNALEGDIIRLAVLAKAKTVQLSGDYPGWKPDANSEILKIAETVYENMFKKQPEIKAIHAGLECGIISGKYPDMDMLSFGPTIRHPHSPDEKVNIATVARFWEFLLAMLKHIPLK
ncbi:MAG: aminoacyl-histidine dipeptidase [Bacteroidales bacterium]|jgi:dipeptidase D|nr:aminoacyl-histidine dipeptidase [Bacteroidales bacterium]